MIELGTPMPGIQFDGSNRTFTLWMPIRTGTGLNQREFWAAKATRVRRERQATRWFWKIHHMFPLEGFRGPMRITLERHSPSTRKADLDNVVGGLKGVRDELCAIIGRDDGDETILWRYTQWKGPWGVKILIEVPMQKLWDKVAKETP